MGSRLGPTLENRAHSVEVFKDSMDGSFFVQPKIRHSKDFMTAI